MNQCFPCRKESEAELDSLKGVIKEYLLIQGVLGQSGIMDLEDIYRRKKELENILWEKVK